MSHRANMDLSIVIPVHNEEKNISLLYKSLVGVLEGLSKSCEIIFVDDGSTDGTFQRLLQLKQEFDSHSRKSVNLRPQTSCRSHLRLIRFKRNFGQTAAMRAGFDHSKGNMVISMDGDLQNDPEDIPKFLEKIEEGYDIVCGWRKNRQDKLISRKVPSRVANWLIGMITGIKIHDSGCSLKAYRAAVIKNTSLYSDMHRFIPVMASLTGAKIDEIVVNHHRRQFGKTKYGLSRVWRVFFDIISMKMLIGFFEKPAVWFGILSIPFWVLGILFLIISMATYFYGQNSFTIIFPSSAMLFLFVSTHLLAMGLLSEYILRLEKLNKNGNDRPLLVEIIE